MIVMPRRSVTRFFIPLIDVLILLFCIFLLMPFVSGPPSTEPASPDKTPEKRLPEDVATLQAQLAETQARLAEEQKRVERLLKQTHADFLKNHLAVIVLDIDPRDGTLIGYDPERDELKTEADAVRFIARQRALANKGGAVKDVYFMIRYPRRTGGVQSSFPTAGQIDRYNEWFKDVPFGYDNS